MQVVMDEAEYQEASAELSLTLAASHVKGVWEERLPLALHTALVVGCVTALLPRARGRALTEGFSLSDLQASRLQRGPPPSALSLGRWAC